MIGVGGAPAASSSPKGRVRHLYAALQGSHLHTIAPPSVVQPPVLLWVALEPAPTAKSVRACAR